MKRLSLYLADYGKSGHKLLIALEEVVKLRICEELLAKYCVLMVPHKLEEVVPLLNVEGQCLQSLRLHV